jgi:hypothetical protein
LQGNGTGGFAIGTTGTPAGSDDQAGIQLDQDPPDGLGIKGNFVGVLTTASGIVDGRANDITLVNYAPNQGLLFKELSIPDFKTVAPLPPLQDTPPIIRNSYTDAVLAFDTYRPDSGSNKSAPPRAFNATTVGYALAMPAQGDPNADYIMLTAGAGGSINSIANNGYFFHTGDGGNSSNGKGGAGGQLGAKLVSVGGVITGTLSIVVPINDAFEPVIRLIAGDGGDGYTAGNRYEF